jgi:hypothetical protein
MPNGSPFIGDITRTSASNTLRNMKSMSQNQYFRAISGTLMLTPRGLPAERANAARSRSRAAGR